MKQKKSFEINKKLKRKIISVAYGDANPLDKIYIYWLARRNHAIKAELNNYQRTAQAVHSLEEECPEELLTNLKLQNVPIPKTKSSIATDFISILVNKPVASAFVAITLIVAVAFSVILNRPVHKNYTSQEVQRANEQASYAIQLIGNILNETTERLENEILVEHVAKPIDKGIEIVNKLLKKE